MTTTSTRIDKWLNATIQSMDETVTGALGFDGCQLIEKFSEIPRDKVGAYIALLSMKVSLQLGIISDAEGCQTLARSLLGMDPGEDALAPPDVADAISEIANIVAGIVKRQMVEEHGNIQLGLPIFIEGNITKTEEQEAAVACVQSGPVTGYLVIVTPGEIL